MNQSEFCNLEMRVADIVQSFSDFVKKCATSTTRSITTNSNYDGVAIEITLNIYENTTEITVGSYYNHFYNHVPADIDAEISDIITAELIGIKENRE